MPLGFARVVLLAGAARSADSLDAMGLALAGGGAVLLMPCALLAGAVWIARRAGKTGSAAVLGQQAAVVGRVVDVGYVAANRN